MNYNIYELHFNILLKSDIDTIENLCYTDKYFYNICQDPFFWFSKFKQDDLTYPNSIPYTSKEWIQMYKLNTKLKYLHTYMYMNEFEPHLNKDVIGYMQSYI